MGTLLFFRTGNILAIDTPLRVHIYDTGYCPHLITPPKNIIILPVVDITQKNNYDCSSTNISGLRFHGQWVLENFIRGIEAKKKIIITPLIIFNKQGLQSLNYWKKALDYSKENGADIIFAAAGIPLKTKKEMIKASEIKLPSAPILLSAGRVSKEISRQFPLFPQFHSDGKKVIIIGSYHQGLKGKLEHFEDTSLINKEKISYYFPFASDVNTQLKGSSYALSEAANFILKYCQELQLEKCLTEHELEITLKNKNIFSKVKTLSP